MWKRITYHPFFIRLFNWEYWSFNTVYFPLYFIWFFLCIRARSFFFFNTANPSIKNGGFLLESKKEIYELIPQEYYPRTLLFKAGITAMEITEELCNNHLSFPLIAKPDIGMRGLQVKKITSYEELKDYASKSQVDFLIQEYISYENETGIFYYRYPGQKKGHISGVVGKELLAVTGDGISTIEALLHKNKRYILQLPILKNTYKEKLMHVLKKDEKFLMVPYGNHARGAKFIDITHAIDEKLVETIDRICCEVDGFYFGRLDIRYNTWDDLKNGKNFSIIELNGAGSEPTHIYDPSHSLFYAWSEIVRHWIILLKISMFNHKLLGLPYMTTSAGLKMFKENKIYVRKLVTTSANL